jgi:hypothetical protein
MVRAAPIQQGQPGQQFASQHVIEVPPMLASRGGTAPPLVLFPSGRSPLLLRVAVEQIRIALT